MQVFHDKLSVFTIHDGSVAAMKGGGARQLVVKNKGLGFCWSVGSDKTGPPSSSTLAR